VFQTRRARADRVSRQRGGLTFLFFSSFNVVFQRKTISVSTFIWHWQGIFGFDLLFFLCLHWFAVLTTLVLLPYFTRSFAFYFVFSPLLFIITLCTDSENTPFFFISMPRGNRSLVQHLLHHQIDPTI